MKWKLSLSADLKVEDWPIDFKILWIKWNELMKYTLIPRFTDAGLIKLSSEQWRNGELCN